MSQPALTSPGPLWLAQLDERWTRRRVWAGPLASLGHCPIQGRVFAKPAEVKVRALPAQVWDDAEGFAASARDAGLRSESWVLVSEVVDFTAEFRCFVGPAADGRPTVTAASAYLVDGVTWDAWDEVGVPSSGAAAAFAERVLGSLSVAPVGFVVDVGVAGDGGWAVVEANASWSSNPYHCAPDGVVSSVLASQGVGDVGEWEWLSDPVFDARARPLTVRRD